MVVVILEKASKELNKFEPEVRNKFGTLFKVMQSDNFGKDKFKKLKGYKNLYEFRVKHNSNIYRAIGGYVSPKLLITVFFQKKTQKTPIRFIELAEKRFNNYLY